MNLKADLQTVESRLGQAMHAVLGELQAAEPEIETGIEAMLTAAGAPATVAAAAEDLVQELEKHFRGQGATPTPAPQPVVAPTSVASGGAIVQPVAASQLSS